MVGSAIASAKDDDVIVITVHKPGHMAAWAKTLHMYM